MDSLTACPAHMPPDPEQEWKIFACKDSHTLRQICACQLSKLKWFNWDSMPHALPMSSSANGFMISKSSKAWGSDRTHNGQLSSFLKDSRAFLHVFLANLRNERILGCIWGECWTCMSKWIHTAIMKHTEGWHSLDAFSFHSKKSLHEQCGNSVQPPNRLLVTCKSLRIGIEAQSR